MQQDVAAVFRVALAARQAAHAPYSNYRVGAVIQCDDGSRYVGCNVENAAYPVGTCAEAGAIAHMVAFGRRRIAFILVVGGEDGPATITPCGACRQRIREFAHDGTIVICASPSGDFRMFRLDELLPHSFGPDNLARSAP